MKRWALSVPLALGAISLVACATAYYPAPPPPPEASAESGPIDVSYFYDQLTPYGEWVEVPTYGRVWSPRGVAAEWRPYTLGHWVYTEDEGWLWVSDEEWGWATYHYGRWYLRSGRWFWVPGTDWAPAWVAWRTGGGYIGWAALPPQAAFAVDLGLRIAAEALEGILEPRAYCFVQEGDFTQERVVTRIVSPGRNVTIINVTRNTTNYTVVQNKVVNRSIPVDQVERAVGHPVVRARVAEKTLQSGPHRAQVVGTEVKVFRPPIQASRGDTNPPAGARPVSGSSPAPPQSKLDQKHAQEKANLEARHTKELQSPPKGVSMDQVKDRHESEHQALQQKQQEERKQSAPREESKPSEKKPH